MKPFLGLLVGTVLAVKENKLKSRRCVSVLMYAMAENGGHGTDILYSDSALLFVTMQHYGTRSLTVEVRLTGPVWNPTGL